MILSGTLLVGGALYYTISLSKKRKKVNIDRIFYPEKLFQNKRKTFLKETLDKSSHSPSLYLHPAKFKYGNIRLYLRIRVNSSSMILPPL